MPSHAPHGLPKDEAEALAIEALQFLAGDPELLGRFLAVSGLGPDTLRTAADNPGFLIGVLEFLMADEPSLLAFAENHRIRPTMIAAARYTLSKMHGDQDGF